MPQHKHHWKDALRHKGVIITLIVVGLIAAWGIGSRVMASFGLRHDTEDQAIPHVAVINAARGPSSEEIVLPGNVQAWHEAPIFARTSGYLKDWKTDIGSPVKAGDLLAEIETPEVDAQFHQAQADLATAEANNQLAQITAKRWGELAKSDSVSKQEVDAKISDAQAKTAMVASAKANLDHLSQLEGFKQVVAPFDGVITARNTDIGALINAGSNTAGTELFRIADTGNHQRSDRRAAFHRTPQANLYRHPRAHRAGPRPHCPHVAQRIRSR
jgi:multidrug efflux pump subunit AcrA (membrane-fusion protein)